MICTYLLRLICVAILISAILSVPLQKPIRRALATACGCVLVLMTLSPLLTFDLQAVLRSFPLTLQTGESLHTEKNDALLQELICTQTEELITSTAKELHIKAEAEVKVKYDENIGSYLPYSVTVTVYGGYASAEGLRKFLTEDLAIPEVRQTWIMK